MQYVIACTYLSTFLIITWKRYFTLINTDTIDVKLLLDQFEVILLLIVRY